MEYRHGCDTNAPAVFPNLIPRRSKWTKFGLKYSTGQSTPRMENKKLEARNPKYETNSNDTIPNLKTNELNSLRFC